MTQSEANAKVLELAGGSHVEVARILGYTDRRNVWPWTGPDKKPFPPHHCYALELHFGADKITRQELRPHDWRKHWPNLVEQQAA
jgi:hypothetical protein